MEDLVIAVGGAEGANSPVLPYIGSNTAATECAELARLYAVAALVRCGPDVINIDSAVTEPYDMAMRVNRSGCDGAVLFSAATFGSGKSFNDVSGASVSACKRSSKSRILAEDVCAKISHETKCSVTESDVLWQTVCPAVTVNAGYATCFEDARMLLDPDYARMIAEHTVIGLCEYFSIPYVDADEVKAYPLLGNAPTGKRGKKIKLLQALLSANGHKCAVDGVYGKSTDEAVKSLCAGVGIKFDGVTAALWRELVLPCNRDITGGTHHSKDVLYVQRKLHAKLYPTPTDGVLCERTVQSLNMFLADEGLTTRASLELIPADAVKALSKIGGGRPRLI